MQHISSFCSEFFDVGEAVGLSVVEAVVFRGYPQYPAAGRVTVYFVGCEQLVVFLLQDFALVFRYRNPR